MNTIENWQKSRVNLVTRKSTAELKEIGGTQLPRVSDREADAGESD